MEKKLTYIASAVLFVILIVLIICEKRYPESGVAFFQSLFS